ncbi:MAG TPA: thiolase family protein [Planctomycetes bacterium]|nr:thiolase family protein [Planctomycetota bacterium]
MSSVVITHALRTPIGKFLGSLQSLTAVELGRQLVQTLLKRSGVAGNEVQELIFGNGRQAGAGPNPARQIAYKAGLSHNSTAYTVNMACASGLKSIMLGVDSILSGDAKIVIAGGTESMSRLPYLLPKAREGYRMGHAPVVDAMYADGFLCPLADQLMGRTAENLAERDGIGRDAQDAYAAESQNRCQRAREAGEFEDEIVPVEVPQRRGDPIVVDRDEHPRDNVTPASLAKLKPVFKENGTVHAGNASGITDGAAAVLLMREEEAKRRGLEILARVEGAAAAGVDPRFMGIGPVPATKKLLEKLGVGLDAFDAIELNEAFAAQVLACLESWKIGNEKVNVKGGAIALGHPIGATGARIVVTLLHTLRQRRLKRGLATLCVSGGLGFSAAFARD